MAVLETTIGMMVANLPAVWMGDALVRRANMNVMRWIVAGLFILLGILALFSKSSVV
ncbi:MAG: TMEM165/GDT1 family protein [Deltaproteobacteria bacterium]|nr:TMEM165/GDT1 family protein [Deltaproteobacteria bacterium]